MKKFLILMPILTFICGCITEPKLEATKPWENHYYTVEELKKNVETIELEKNESIWLMSNHTLNRLLKNIGK